jgi:iron complex transport system substrate-binding protein
MSLQSTKAFARIVTLDPAATEILFELGLGERVVAVSHDSDFPPEARNRPVVSFSKLGNLDDSKEIGDRVKEFVERGESLYEVDSNGLTSLGADLVITQNLCGLCAVSSLDVERAVSRMTNDS